MHQRTRTTQRRRRPLPAADALPEPARAPWKRFVQCRDQTTGTSRPLPQTGFTLLELMVIVAIAGILAAIAVPGFCDYIARSQVSDGLRAASRLYQPIEAYWHDQGRLPSSLADLSDKDRTPVNGIKVAKLQWLAGGLLVRMAPDGHRDVRGARIHIRAAFDAQGQIAWVCGYAAIPNGYSTPSTNLTDIGKRNLPRSCLHR